MLFRSLAMPRLLQRFGPTPMVLGGAVLASVFMGLSGFLRAQYRFYCSGCWLASRVRWCSEQGLPRFEAVSWYALVVPSGTPRDVVDRLSVETQRLFARPDLKDKLAALGMDAGAGKPQALAAAIQAETVRWAEVIRQKNIKHE